MKPIPFRIDVEDDGTLLVLRLRGELDLGTMREVQEAVENHCRGREALVIDMRELDFMDSSGLRLMIELQGRDDGTTVAFLSPRERVGRLLDMTGVRDTLTWVDEPRQALTDDSRSSSPVSDDAATG
jgi:anti-sigma B factor antagonist